MKKDLVLAPVAAEKLGVSRSTFYNIIKGLPKKDQPPYYIRAGKRGKWYSMDDIELWWNSLNIAVRND